eukprot:270770-Hanusia_phi.AAC.6
MQVKDPGAVHHLLGTASLWQLSLSDLIKSSPCDLVLSQMPARGRPKGSRDSQPRKRRTPDLMKRKFCIKADDSRARNSSTSSSSDEELTAMARQDVAPFIPSRCRIRTAKHHRLLVEITRMCQQLSRHKAAGHGQGYCRDVVDAVMQDLLGEISHSCGTCGECRPCPCTSRRGCQSEQDGAGKVEDHGTLRTKCATYSDAICMPARRLPRCGGCRGAVEMPVVSQT